MRKQAIISKNQQNHTADTFRQWNYCEKMIKPHFKYLKTFKRKMKEGRRCFQDRSDDDVANHCQEEEQEEEESLRDMRIKEAQKIKAHRKCGEGQ